MSFRADITTVQGARERFANGSSHSQQVVMALITLNAVVWIYALVASVVGS